MFLQSNTFMLPYLPYAWLSVADCLAPFLQMLTFTMVSLLELLKVLFKKNKPLHTALNGVENFKALLNSFSFILASP